MCFCNNNLIQQRNMALSQGYRGFNCGYNPYVKYGIVGPRGPAGPQGPVGPRGINDSIYAEVATATVATNTIVPLFQTTATNQTTSSVTSGAVNITEGVYLVTYGFNGTPSVSTEGISLTLYANGSPLANGELVQTGAGEISASKTILYNATTNGALSLYNTTSTTETITYPYISVTKLQ